MMVEVELTEGAKLGFDDGRADTDTVEDKLGFDVD